MERFREEHSAECSACGYVAETAREGTFLTPFFLPKLCPECGEHMLGLEGYSDRPHWLHVIRVYRLVEPIKTRNPLTWLRCSHWDEVEDRRYSYAA